MFQTGEDKLWQKQKKKLQKIEVDNDNELFFVEKQLSQIELENSKEEEDDVLADELTRINKKLQDKR